MSKWHNLCWEDKLRSLDRFEDDRLVALKNIIYQEAPQILPETMQKEIKRDIAKRS